MERQIALEELSSVLGISLGDLDETKSFVSHGGHSITALQFAARCIERGVSVSVDSILVSQTLQELLQSCDKLDPVVSLDSTSNHPHPVIDKQSDVPDHWNAARRLSMTSVPGDGHADTDLVSISSDNSGNMSSPEQATIVTTPASGFGILSPAAVKPLEHDVRVIHTEVETICGPQHQPDIIGELTEIQLSLIHGSMQNPGTNIIHYYETYYAAQVPQMKAAWKEVLRQEPIFRTTYINPEDGCWLIPKIYWRELETSRWTYKNILKGHDGVLPVWPETDTSSIDLGIRFSVVSVRDTMAEDNISTVIWSIHHALIDGWSAAKVLYKVRRVASGISVSPNSSFLDVAASLENLRKLHQQQGDEFWSERKPNIAAAHGKLLLPHPIQSPPVIEKRTSGEFHLSLEQHWDRLDQAARSCGVTLPTILYAAWTLSIASYADSDNVMFGAVVSGRNLPLPGALDAVGPLLNTLPFQMDISGNRSVRGFLVEVFKRLNDLSRFAWTAPDNGFSRSFESVLAIQLDIAEPKIGSEELKPIRQPFSRQTTNIPLSVIINGKGQAIFQFSPAYYYRRHIQAVAKCFRDTAVSLTRLDMSIQTCLSGLISTESLATLRGLGNCDSGWTTRASSSDDLVTLFEATAAKYPGNIAIQNVDQTVTYAELDRLSSIVARYIASKISPEEVVPVHADGSLNWLIAIWGVLRAGGTYCAIDQAHPQAVRDSISEACSAKYFLATDDKALGSCPRGATCIDIAEVLNHQPGQKSDNDDDPIFARRTRPRPWTRAYVCFTSGSTGNPKGVVCTHEGLVAFQRDFDVRLRAQPGCRIAQFMSAAFDGSIHELFSCLCYGATLVLRDTRDPMGHLKVADSAILTPSIASHLDPSDFPSLKTVYLVGEAVPQSVCDKWAAQKTVFNMYGPTEGTCGATITQLMPGRPVTIGRPNPSTRIYILNRHRQLAPVGTIGEVWLAGVQVAQGYIGQPVLTDERFHPDTICKGLGENMYRTGDRGYWNNDGEIVFLGRTDRQIKLRGFRLDLDDLEARILQCCHGARAVAVVLSKNKTNLVCMIQKTDGDVSQMRDSIAEALPTYAVPRHIAITDSLPMTLTGKVDYKAVAASASWSGSLEVDRLHAGTEVKIAGIWARVLDLDPRTEAITPSSNFVELGGHSLRQLRLVSKLSTEFSCPVTLRMITELPTLRNLAQEIDKMRLQALSENGGAIKRGREPFPLGRFVTSPAEREWWSKYSLDRGSAAFNVSFVCRYDPDLVDQERLGLAWNQVLGRHEVFRSLYIHHRRRGLERVLSPQPPVVQRVASVDVWLELNTPFQPETALPVRVVMSKDMVVATWNHIVCDYTTLSLLLAEVAAAYRGDQVPRSLQSYHESTAWHAVAPPCSLQFWGEYLHGAEHVQAAYLGNARDRTSYQGTSSMARVSPTLWHRLRTYLENNQFTAQQVILAVVGLALSSRDESLNITLGIPFINRRSEEDMRTIGLFLEPLPVRIAFCDPDDSRARIFPAPPLTIGGYVGAVQSLAQRALANAVPWGQLLEHLGINGDELLPNHPLFDCVVSFHDMRPTALSVGGAWNQLDLGPGIQPQLVWSQGSKFKLMVEFTAVRDDSLLIRLEHDTSCYEGPKHIASVRRMILRSLEFLLSADGHVTGAESCQSFTEVREHLKQAWLREEQGAFSLEESHEDTGLVAPTGDMFQTSLSSL